MAAGFAAATKTLDAWLTEVAAETGIAGLKIRHNNVLGYFIEVTAAHADRLHGEARFIHRQTLANAVRFTTVELSDLETRIVNAGARAIEIEKRIFAALSAAILEHQGEIAAAARALAAQSMVLTSEASKLWAKVSTSCAAGLRLA